MAESSATLQELVNSICERLHAERQLITNHSVKKLVLLHENWVADTAELDQQLPSAINAWRLTSLYADPNPFEDNLSMLTAQICKYKSDLLNTEHTIKQLKAELLAKNLDLKQLRNNIIQELRGLLHD